LAGLAALAPARPRQADVIRHSSHADAAIGGGRSWPRAAVITVRTATQATRAVIAAMATMA
jgi:hypothetical protein